MKNAIKILCCFIALSVAFVACKKDEKRLLYSEGQVPVLSADRTVLGLSFITKDDAAIKLSWTNPDYKFNTGISSLDVNYLLEIDTTGANFTNPKKKTVSIPRDLSVSYTQSQINDFLLNQLELAPGMPHNIEMRITATLKSQAGEGIAVPLVSNVLKYAVTPYAIPPKVTPPASGTLYITGSATPASWQCGCGEPELLTQKFNQISPTLYELPSIVLSADNSYLLLPVYGSWAAKYGGVGANNTNNVDGDDFKPGGGDLKAPSVGGAYKIVVNFQTGKFQLTKL